MSRWARVPMDDLSAVPDLPGVYTIYHKGLLVYVGQTIKLRSRLRQHITDTLPKFGVSGGSCFAKISSCRRIGEWVMREMRLILRLKPAWNVQFGLDFNLVGLEKVLNKTTPIIRQVDDAAYWRSVILRYKDDGHTNNDIAIRMNRMNAKSPTGKRWTPMGVKLVKRVEATN